MRSTTERLGDFTGGQRILAANNGLDDALSLLDDLKPADTDSVLMHYYETRAEGTPISTVITGNQFNTPSDVSPRDFHEIDAVIYDQLPTVEFVDLAPTQPLGTSSQLAGTNQKNIMPGLRRSEVNSDATTALFREAYTRHVATGEETHLATNTRITRMQTFDPETGFLPHFRMFAQVTVGSDPENRGPRELETLSDHLASEIHILDRFAGLPRADITNMNIKISNIVFLEDMIARGLILRTEARRRTQDSTFDLLGTAGIVIDEPLTFSDNTMLERIKDAGFQKGLSVVERIKNILDERHPKLVSRTTFDLGRCAGMGYYRHLCYRIEASNSSGLTLPLVDGGTTNWAQKVDARRKLTHTITSGIGVELLAKHFMRPLER